MQTQHFLLLVGLVFSSHVWSAVQVKNLKTNANLNPSLYTATEGFVALDQVNSVYGVEIIFKDLALPENYRIVNADDPEKDFSFLNKYELNNAASASTEALKDTTSTLTIGLADLINTVIVEKQIRVVTGSQKTYIKDAAGVDLFEIDWATDKKGLISRGCPPELFRLREIKNLATKGPMGVSCNFSMSPSLVTISPMKEVRWTSTNMPELSGKGERYRTFEIPVGNLKGTASGAFRLSSDGQSLTFAVFVKKIEEKVAALAVAFDKKVALGMTSATLAGPTSSAGSSSFFYEFDGLTEHVFDFIKFGFGFYNSFTTGEDPSAISTRDSKMTAGYYSNSKSSFNWGTWLGHRNFDIKQDLTSTKFQSSQFGFGLDGVYAINSNNKIIARFEMASLGSKVVKSHMKIGVDFKIKLVFGKTQFNTGALFETQTMKLAAPDGSSRDFGLTKFGISLDF